MHTPPARGLGAVNLPAMLQVEITSSCNLRCRMCPLTLKGTVSSRRPGHMEVVVWDRLLEMARRVELVILTGFGEPTTNPRFLPLLQELDASGVPTCFSTNGINVGERLVRGLAALNYLTSVNVSIDSPDPAIYRDIRGGDVFAALEGLRRLTQGLPRVHISVSSVVMESNAASLVGFPPILARLGVKTYCLQGLHDVTSSLDDEQLYNQRNDPRVLDAIRSQCLGLGINVHFEYEHRQHLEMTDKEAALQLYHHEAAFSADRTKQCLNPWNIPFVDKDGNVLPCCHADQTAVMGNIGEEDFNGIWGGRRFQRFREDLLDGRTLPQVCRKCPMVPAGPHPYNQYAARILYERSRLGGRMGLKLVVENTGRLAWTRDTPIELRAEAPPDQRPAHYHPRWLSRDRVCRLAEDSVPPGSRGTFRFYATPASPGGGAFQLVIDAPEVRRVWGGRVPVPLPGTRFEVQPAWHPADLVPGVHALLRRSLGRARRWVRNRVRGCRPDPDRS